MKTDPGALLDDTWFGRGMSEPVLARLRTLGRLVAYPDGATVIAPGLPAPALGVVVSGRIGLRLAVPGVALHTILTLEDGDIFGWSSLLPGSVATAMAVALAPTTALLFERADLTAAMTADCALASAVYERVLGAVARRLQATRLQLLDLYRPGNEPW